MQDDPEEVNGCGFLDGLRGEEIVGLGRDPGADRGRLRREGEDAVANGVGEVLDDEAELGERRGEGDGGAARGAADLSKTKTGGFNPPLSASATKVSLLEIFFRK